MGWKEWLALPDLKIPAIKAKIDTGARTSSLHTFHLEPYREKGALRVRFSLHPLQKRKDIEIFSDAKVVDYRKVKDSGGHIERRYVIQTLMVVGKTFQEIELTLTNRDKMMFRMLLGRTALKKKFIIDPGRAYVMGRRLARSY